MLPNLKNLDVIVTPRAPRVCRSNTFDNNDENDDAQNGAASKTVSEIPKELEGKDASEFSNYDLPTHW